MDIRLISCLLFVMVLFMTTVIKTNAANTQAQGQNNTTTNTTAKPVNVQAVKNTTTNTTTKPVNGQKATQSPVQPGNAQGATQAPAQQVNAQGATQAPGTTTPAPKQCVNGSCTAKVDDESCLQNIQGKCPLAHSCTKEVKKKNATHSVVTVGCGACPRKPAITTTVKPPTPAPSTTTLTCCETDLCNQYQIPQSAAFALRTNNIFYAIGLLALKICI